MPGLEPHPKKQLIAARAHGARIEAAPTVPSRPTVTTASHDTGIYATSIDAWPMWSITYANTNTASTTLLTGNTAIWGHWSGTATTTTVTSTTWEHWAGSLYDAAAAQQAIRQQQQQRYADPTAEQRETWRQQELAHRARQEKQRIDTALARVRAKTLLMLCLSDEQRESVAKKECFYMECHSANGTKRRYRIDTSYTHGNVKLVDDKNSVIGQYCVQPNGVPIEDAVLAQKLWLETNEEEFKRKANYTPHHASRAA